MHDNEQGHQLSLTGTVVLVTDGDQRAALAATRDLRSAGCIVYVAANGAISLAGASRGARALVHLADPKQSPDHYADEILELAKRVGADVVLPTTDASVHALLGGKKDWPAAIRLAATELLAYEHASDKVKTLGLASASGLAAPPSVIAESRSDMAQATAGIGYPAVVKPRASLVRADNGSMVSMGVQIAKSADDVIRIARELPDDAFPLLIQRHVHGVGIGVFLLRWEGQTVAHFTHRRIREKPPSGGVSVFRESTATSPRVLSAAETMLDALSWNGVAMIECRHDTTTDTYWFMEINGRLWGSLQLAIDAGVRFPTLLVASAIGKPAPPQTPYRVGVRSRWLWGDLDHLYARLRYSRERLGIPNSAPSRLGAIAQFLMHDPSRDRFEVERWDDPGPSLLETGRRLRLRR